MTIPKMPERKEEISKEHWGFNQCLDIAEKMVEAIVERLEDAKEADCQGHDCECCRRYYDKVNTIIQELQPPEQSPKGEC